MDIDLIRKDTLGCKSNIHLNNAGASLMPRKVADAIRDYISEEEIYGGYETAEKHANELEKFYTYSATLLHCQAKNIAFCTSATDSFDKALSSIPFHRNDVILTTTNDYPSNFIAFLSLQKRYGVDIILVDNTRTGEIDLEDLQHKIKKHSPRLLSISHVPTSSGLVQPVEQIGAIVKNYDCIFLLDACQSLGQLDLDALQTHAHFISGTFRKFLRGPRGAGLLYVSDKALEMGLEPLFPDLRGAGWTAVNHYTSRSDARRFEHWETAYALLNGSKEAVAYLLKLGIENVQKRNDILVHKLRNKLISIPHIKVLDRGSRQCSIITFSVEATNETAAKTYFQQKKINVHITDKSSALVDFREKGIDWAVRVSPHYYNTEQEINIFVDAVREMSMQA
jgi:selenocysteine lyase/cysteine desulfurase